MSNWSYSNYAKVLPEVKDYFPFEIGEIIQNKYEVFIYNI